MNDRTLINRLLSPAGFGLVLIFFLMPFVTVACGVDQKSQIRTTFTGLTLVTGGQPRVEDQPPDQAARLLDIFSNTFYPEVLVVLAALAVIAGIAIGFLRAAPIRHGSSLGLAVLAVGLLVLEIRHTPSRIVDALATLYDPANPGPALEWSVHPRYGFWLAVSGLVLLAAYHSAMLVQNARGLAARTATGPAPPYAAAEDYAGWQT